MRARAVCRSLALLLGMSYPRVAVCVRQMRWSRRWSTLRSVAEDSGSEVAPGMVRAVPEHGGELDPGQRVLI